MTARRRLLRLLPVLAALILLSLTAVACGTEEDKTDLIEGEPVELGDLEYNVLFSRFLNPNDVEDREYLVGQPAPEPDELYLGVFMQVENTGDEAARLPETLTVTDTGHQTYFPIESESPYALHLGDRIGGKDEAPALDSSAQVGPIGGSMVLFSISDQSTEDRPLKLIIPGQDGPAEVELDI
ncbi:MAG: hypothetical protein AABM29_07285 [Actinomycetota bacterium]